MARGDADDLVTQSLLDRLTDLEPKLKADQPITRAQSIRHLKTSLRRDLEWLFNTRANADIPSPEVLPEVFRSVFNYGLPDYTHLTLNNFRDRQRMQKQLEIAIGLFEPRLMGVQVRLTEQSFEAGKALRFQVDALLKMAPSPERISFDTVLDIPSGEYEVKGEASAR